MLFGYLTLLTALILSLSSAVYSILGLTAIFAAAFWPIVVLGGSLEIGKIVTTLWLHKYWKQAELQYKVYLSFAVAVLMVLTSMGVFGFLSKAHLDQAVPSGNIAAQVQIFDDKIRTQQDNIKSARAALAQMDAAVDQTMSRSTTESGADKAANLRRSQARERTALQNDISKAQKEITVLQEQRAPIASEMRKVEAEVGPIKYIAALIYGVNPDTNLLEAAVRWVIILIVIVFDPLALTLLLAATKALEWERNINLLAPKRKDPDYEPDDGPLTDEQVEQIQAMANAELPTGNVIETDTLFDDEYPFRGQGAPPGMPLTAGYMQPTEPEYPPDDALLTDDQLDQIHELADDEDTEEHLSMAEKQARSIWKQENPNDTLKHQKRLLKLELITQLPWNELEFRERTNTQDGNLWIPGTDGEWINAGPVDQYDLGLQADNTPAGVQGEMRGFGTDFPLNPVKGNMFLRVDQLPSVLYKFNGNRWIEVDKTLSDQHAYDDAYIDHLIEKISTGEYDPDLLSNAERDRIEQRLNGNK